MADLTFKKSEKTKKWRKQSMLIIGPPKIGKSELLAQDGTLFLDCEGGLNHLPCIKYPEHRPFLDWDEMEGYVDRLVAMKQKGTFPVHIDCIAIDTATRFTQLATDKTVDIYVGKLTKGDNVPDFRTIEEIPLGGDKGNPGWATRQNLIQGLSNKLKQLDVCLVWIGHLDHKKIKSDVNGQVIELDKSTISIGGQVGKFLVSDPDHVLNMVAVNDGGIIKRTVRTIGTASMDAGSRGRCILDKWQLENPKSLSDDDLAVAAKNNYAKLRSFFQD